MKIEPELVETARYVLRSFRDKNQRIATVESCTGGLISAVLTSVAGSSDVFDRGYVTYTNQAKTDLVGVPAELIEELGAVSAEVAMAMAQGGLDRSGANVVASVTGIAGPGGGSEEKPVGLVYVAIASPQGLYVEELRFGDIGRDAVRNQSAQAALEMLVAFGLEDEFEDLGDYDPPLN
jgi:nicotinamide-nucleotide amidase